jgi:hypothetical protein
MVEQRLPGGRSLGAVRIDGAVHRTAQPWTPAVHAVLRYLEAEEFAGAPRVIGFDDQGREMLTYLSGDTVGDRLPWPAWAHSDTALAQVGAWLRRLHDVTAAFVPPEDVTWFARQTWRPGLVIGHHDAAPWNAVWHDGALAGIVDWDTVGPSSRELDLAFAALSWVPLLNRRLAEETGFTAFDDRSRRLHLLLDAYGYAGDRRAFGDAVAARARMNATAIRRLAGGGDPTFVAMLPWAADLEESAVETGALPEGFWSQIRRL